MGAVVAEIAVDNPLDRASKIVVLRSLRDDPLGRLHARHQIDEAQFQAGRRYQRALEDAAIGSIKAVDTTIEPVDGRGQFVEPITDRTRRAAKLLANADAKLGDDGKNICRGILGEGLSIEMLARLRGQNTRYLGQRFRECLERLAVVFHLA